MIFDESHSFSYSKAFMKILSIQDNDISSTSDDSMNKHDVKSTNTSDTFDKIHPNISVELNSYLDNSKSQ